MTKLTQKAAEEYIKSNGIDCPYCDGHDTVVASYSNPENGVAECRCSHCEQEWDEYWNLVGIGESGGGDPFTVKEKHCLVRVIEAEILYGCEPYMQCVLLSPKEETFVVLGYSDDPLNCITSEDYDKYLDNCREQAKIWQCDIEIMLKKDDYFTEGEE